MGVDHPDLEIIKFTVKLADGTTLDVQVAGNPEVVVEIPEHTEYEMTIVFRVKTRTLTNLKYKQEFKMMGVVAKTKVREIGPEFEPRDEPYSKTFEKDRTPGGMMMRGKFDCTLTYLANGEELFRVPWVLNITKA